MFSREDIKSNTAIKMPPKKKNGIPDRWTDYTAVGKRIPGTRFIAFKVPLKKSLMYRLTELEAFGPFDLVHMLEKDGQELGLIIDLTFTTRYYKVEDLPDTLHYMKIFTAGHEVPDDATILSFKKAVRHFLRENESNDKLIGVHCTHGLNRTGYLVCRYLIDVDGMEPRKAINLFNASRGHSIERQNYLDDLTAGPKRSNVGIDVPEQEPDVGRLSLRDDFSHPHRSDQHYHHAPFSGQQSHPQGHRERQHQFVPFPQRNDMMRFAPPQRQPLRPPLFPTPPPETRLMRPSFPNQRYRGGNSGPMLPYPPPLPAYRFGQPWQDPNRHPLPFPPGGPVRNQSGPHRKHRHRGKKGPKNTGNFQ